MELEVDWPRWNYFCWILEKCGSDSRQDFLVNPICSTGSELLGKAGVAIRRNLDG